MQRWLKLPGSSASSNSCWTCFRAETKMRVLQRICGLSASSIAALGRPKLSTPNPESRLIYTRRRCEIAKWDAGAAGPSKPATGRHDAIEAQIRHEIAVMQGVMICDLRQDEHLVRLDAPEVCRVIEVRIGEPGVHAIAVTERAFEVRYDLGLRNLRASRGGIRFTLDV